MSVILFLTLNFVWSGQNVFQHSFLCRQVVFTRFFFFFKAAYQVSSLGPQETHHHRVKWPEPYHLYACGHEILWVTGIEKFEGHHRPPAVCLLSTKVSRQCSHFGTALHPTNSILFADFSSAFNTINPVIIHQKVTLLTGPRITYQWLTSFQSDRQ